MNRSTQLTFAWLGVATGIIATVVTCVIAALNGHPQALVLASTTSVGLVAAGVGATTALRRGEQR
ncbi:hypothetical protein [Propioniciclava sp.]|uniref:hypothetical protein n=1 Tax=Propioniciclava sp. TaxID=2038686 RepID=UPI00262BA728|nr:hypothetical protein [Propioniciclava sp.]